MSASLPGRWLDRAAEDLKVAGLVLRERHYAHACFLAQQATEKAMKAFLLVRSNAYPRTRKLVDLLGECEALENSFSQFLPQCAVPDQY